MALPSVPHWGRIDEKWMDSAGYFDPYRCHETSTDAVSKDEERAAYISCRPFTKMLDFADLERRARLLANVKRSSGRLLHSVHIELACEEAALRHWAEQNT